MAAIKKVWTPTEYEVNIGNGVYIVKAVPIERLIEFDAVVKSLGTELEGLDDRYYVGDEQFDTQDAAETFIQANGLDTGVRVEGAGLRDILGKLVGAPYPALKVMIPDLKEEDVLAAPIPNLTHVVNLIVEVNGIEWFERFLKNSLGPLLPQLLKTGVDAAQKALANFTDQNGSSGETA